jgi:hypothetical protein
MACPTMFFSALPTSDRLSLSDEAIDEFHAYCDATERKLIDEIVHGAGDDYGRRSMLPATRSVPTHWLAEIDEENEVMQYALEN